MPVHADWKVAPKPTWTEEKLGQVRSASITSKVLAVLAFVFIVGLRLDEPPLAIMSSFCVASLIAWMALTSTSFNMLSPRLKQWLKDEGGEGHVAIMTVLVDDKAIGQDQGLVSFDGDRLFFKGLSTSFQVSTGDVSIPWDQLANGPLMREKEEKWRYGNLIERSAWGFNLNAESNTRIYFFPLEVSGYPSLCRPLFEWLQKEPVSHDDSVLPPCDPMPGYKPPSFLSLSRKGS